MIVHVWRRAMEAKVGPVLVAAGESDFGCHKKIGGDAVLTNPDLPSGSDRIHAAHLRSDQKFDAIINLRAIYQPLSRHQCAPAWNHWRIQM